VVPSTDSLFQHDRIIGLSSRFSLSGVSGTQQMRCMQLDVKTKEKGMQ
jgi:hypothetical protein